MNAALALVLGSAAATTMLICHLLFRRRVVAVVEPSSHVALPVPMRLLMRIATPWEASIARLLSPRIAASLRGQLARAGLHHEVEPARWIALLTSTVAVAALTWMLAAAMGLSPGPAGLLGVIAPPLALHAWLRQRAAGRSNALLKELPTVLELLVLCLETGASLGVALRIAGDKSAPGPMRDLLTLILQRIRAGQSRSVALNGTLVVLDLEATTALATALVQAETSGMSLGPVLRAQAEQVMTARFIRAERAAMQAPVKLLLPLLACIFPCTFIVIAIPIVSRLMGIATA